MRLIDVDLISMEMEMEKHVAKSSAQKSLALDPKKQKEFKKKLKKINSKVMHQKVFGLVYTEGCDNSIGAAVLKTKT